MKVHERVFVHIPVWNSKPLQFLLEKCDYQTIRTLAVTSSGLGAQKFQQPPGDENQSDGVGIFAKFRGIYMYMVVVWLHTCIYVPFTPSAYSIRYQRPRSP